MEVGQFTLDFTHTASPKIEGFHGFSWQKKIIALLDKWKDSNDLLSVHTSGSTGVPKKISLSKKHIIQSAEATCKFLNLRKGNKALLCLPVHYIAGKLMLIRASVLGLKLICIEPESTIMLSQNVDFGAMTPMQVACSKESIEFIGKLIIGGAPIALSVERSVYGRSNQIYETFGMTETISHFAMRNLTKRESFFTILPNVGIKTDQENRLSVKMPWDRQWIKTNDLVEQLSHHKFIWLGRLDNIINSAGVKMFAEEIENKLESIIKSNFIIASLPDQILGESLTLIVEGEPSDNKKSQLQRIINHTSLLSKYEKPKQIYFLSEFVRTQAGKINRKETVKLVLG